VQTIFLRATFPNRKTHESDTVLSPQHKRSATCIISVALGITLLFAVLPKAAVTAEPALEKELTPLTRTGLFKRDPVFVDGGESLVFVLLERPEQLRLMRLNLRNGATTPLHPDETRSELEPAFSRDGRYYAFLQSRSAASVAMVIRDTQESRDAEVPAGAGFAGMRHPAIAPDNSRLVYSYPEDGRQQIYAVNMQAGDRQPITDSGGINNWPGFSPDGKQIVFGSTRDGNFEIYLMDADGSNVRRLTRNRAQDLRPRFSPDGQRVAFTSNRDGNYEIYLVDSDGSGLQRLTNHPERDDYAAWHPNGKQLVSVSERAGRFDLYLIPVP